MRSPKIESISMEYLAETIRASKKYGAQVVVFNCLSDKQIEIIKGAGYSVLEEGDSAFIFIESVPRGTIH